MKVEILCYAPMRQMESTVNPGPSQHLYIATVIYKIEVIQLKKSSETPIALLQLGRQEIQHPDPG